MNNCFFDPPLMIFCRHKVNHKRANARKFIPTFTTAFNRKKIERIARRRKSHIIIILRPNLSFSKIPHISFRDQIELDELIAFFGCDFYISFRLSFSLKPKISFMITNFLCVCIWNWFFSQTKIFTLIQTI